MAWQGDEAGVPWPGVRKIPADPIRAEHRISKAREALALAHKAKAPDLALTLAYDAIRKSAAGLLEAKGYRVAARSGGHTLTLKAASAVLTPSEPEAAQQLLRAGDALRSLRNTAEYGVEESITEEDAEFALSTAEYLLPVLEKTVKEIPRVDSPGIA